MKVTSVLGPFGIIVGVPKVEEHTDEPCVRGRRDIAVPEVRVTDHMIGSNPCPFLVIVKVITSSVDPKRVPSNPCKTPKEFVNFTTLNSRAVHQDF